MHVERTLTVPRPVDSVFDYLADFTRTEQWDPGTVTTTRTGGDGGLGTTYDNVSEFLGRRVEVSYETVTCDRPRELRFRGTNAHSESFDWLRLRPVSDRATEIHYRADFHFSGVYRLAAQVLVRPRLAGVADETVEQLTRALLEHTS